LIVSGEDGFRINTREELANLRFIDRAIDLVEASSAEEARRLLSEQEEIAAAVIDRELETTNAGLELAQHIRQELGDRCVRLVLRSRQPPSPRERHHLLFDDIDHLLGDKDLQGENLRTTVEALLCNRRGLHEVNEEKRGLLRVLEMGAVLHRLDDHQALADTLLANTIELCNGVRQAEAAHLEGGVLVITTAAGRTEIIARQGDMALVREKIQQDLEQLILRLVHRETVSLRETLTLRTLNCDDTSLATLLLHGDRPLSNLQDLLLSALADHGAIALRRMRQIARLKAGYREAVQALAIAAEFRDVKTRDHIARIQYYVEEIAKRMGLPAEKAEEYGMAAITHDLGKLAIPDAILLKPEILTSEEYEVVKQHPRIGAEILAHSPRFALAAAVAHSHHERWDGSGYPDMLQGDTIPLAARIMAVVDVFDALVNERHYKERWSVEQAIEEIRKGAGTQFDPEVVAAFLDVLAQEGHGPLA